MSHYTKCKTKIMDAEALVKALNDMGYKHVEVHKEATNLYGYHGDKRAQTSEIIVRRKYIDASANDVGFKKQEDGTYEAMISEYDSGRHNEGWLKKLNQRYSYHKVTKELEEMGYEAGAVTTENGQIKFTAVDVQGG